MILNARNPKWGNPDKTKIEMEIELDAEGNWVPFVAAPDDCTDYGAALFKSAVNGNFGAVQDSDDERMLRGELPPPDGFLIIDGQLVYTEGYEQAMEIELERRFAELNSEESKARAEIDETYAADRKALIITLLDVRNQEGWPFNADWPDWGKQ
ncbi:MAG: hypothetical protein LBI06_07295 [Treponema sp.]|jgi:hypothetical protein|nr:hypothetical protein [Treponema sp.]